MINKLFWCAYTENRFSPLRIRIMSMTFSGRVAVVTGAGGLDHLDSALPARGIQIGHHDIQALGRESQCRGPPDTGAGPGHHSSVSTASRSPKTKSLPNKTKIISRLSSLASPTPPP